MYVQLAVMVLLVLAAPFRAETEEAATPCTEAQANYNSCNEEKGHEECWDLYYKVLGACYSKAWQECAETEHEYYGKDCDKTWEEEERDESCDGLKEKIGRICTNEWYAQLDQTPGPSSGLKK